MIKQINECLCISGSPQLSERNITNTLYIVTNVAVLSHRDKNLPFTSGRLRLVYLDERMYD